MPETSSVNQPSNASDFQPPTRNPQDNAASNLQTPGGGSLQPVGDSGTGLSGSQLYERVDNGASLQVQTAQGSPTSSTAPRPTVHHSLWLLPTLLAIGGIVILVSSIMTLRKMRRPAESTAPAKTEPTETTAASSTATKIAKTTAKPKKQSHAKTKSKTTKSKAKKSQTKSKRGKRNRR